MIFVTVGTHEQPFNRLITYIDQMKKENIIDEEVIMQTGYSTYEPQFCMWQNLYPYQQMMEFVEKARIIITHGGPSSFLMSLQVGKIPIVVPRQKKFNEHVNDHQISFAQEISKRMGNIITVIDLEHLNDIIINYDTIISNMENKVKSNNAKFNSDFEKIVEEMMMQRKQK